MLSERGLSSLTILAVALITAGYLMFINPEDSSVSSLDGIVTVTGFVRHTQPLTVTMGSALAAPLIGSGYLTTPDGVVLEEPVRVSFKIFETDLALIDGYRVYRFHESLDMWEAVTPVVAHTSELIAIETARLGTFAVGQVPNFSSPVFADVYAELLAAAPNDAVGYELAVGFSQPDQELVRILELGEQGGCNGVVRVGDGEASTRFERQAIVDIGDTPTSLKFVFVARWFTSSNGGCAQAEPLQPLSEYGILDKIQI